MEKALRKAAEEAIRSRNVPGEEEGRLEIEVQESNAWREIVALRRSSEDELLL
jgi:hypothetical protein